MKNIVLVAILLISTVLIFNSCSSESSAKNDSSKKKGKCCEMKKDKKVAEAAVYSCPNNCGCTSGDDCECTECGEKMINKTSAISLTSDCACPYCECSDNCECSDADCTCTSCKSSIKATSKKVVYNQSIICPENCGCSSDGDCSCSECGVSRKAA